MDDNAASRVEQLDSWCLLAEFAVAELSGCDQGLLDQAMGALQGLNLQSVQLERIRSALMEALSRTERRGNSVFSRLRIWVHRAHVSRLGWGFFLVDKSCSMGKSSDEEPDHLLELFLYQE